MANQSGWLDGVRAKLGLLGKLLRMTPQQIEVFQYFKSHRQGVTHTRMTVAVECPSDSTFHWCVFGLIVSLLREKQSLRVDQVVTHSLNAGESKSLFSILMLRLVMNKLLVRKWEHNFSSFCDAVAYRSVSFNPFGDSVDLWRSWSCWRSLKNRQALSRLLIDGVLVGDLVNDSFLRFKPAPTVDLHDRYLWIVLWQTHRDVRRAKRYFALHRPRLYFTSYATYIQHGVAVRVALLSGVKVYSIGNVQELTKQLTLADWFSSKNSHDYASRFANMGDQQEKLKRADVALSSRVAGDIDPAMAYMRKSAYAQSRDKAPDIRGAVVVFLHDFFDSPHVYSGLVFTDFWEWACFTIETLQLARIRFFVKPHPNQIGLSSGAFNELKLRYPTLSILPPTITNRQLVNAGMVCGVTMYGSVAHELAYLGVPSVACACHPHVSFDFCLTATSRDRYAQLLCESVTISVDKAIMRRQSLEFYYMHNLDIEEDERMLRDNVWSIFWACYETGEPEDRNLVDDLKNIASMPAVSQHIERWLTDMRRPPRHLDRFETTVSK